MSWLGVWLVVMVFVLVRLSCNYLRLKRHHDVFSKKSLQLIDDQEKALDRAGKQLDWFQSVISFEGPLKPGDIVCWDEKTGIIRKAFVVGIFLGDNQQMANENAPKFCSIMDQQPSKN